MNNLAFICLFLARDSFSATIWKGIRYAEPVERWRAPVPYKLGFDHAVANRQEEYEVCPQENADQPEVGCFFFTNFQINYSI